MVLIKKIFLLSVFTLCLLPWSKAEAKLAVVNTDFYKTATIDGLTVTFGSEASELRQWVVELLDQGDHQELGIYPSNHSTNFNLKSAHTLEYSVDAGQSWQLLNQQNLAVNKVWLRQATNINNSSSLSDELKLDLADDQYSLERVDNYIYPENLQLISGIYRLDAQSTNYKIKFYYNIDSHFSKNIYQYNEVEQTWQNLGAYNNIEEKYVSISLKNQDQPLILAIFQDLQTHDGIASFYNQARYRSFGYKNGNFVASRFYPKGTKLKITRLLTGKSIIVTVNDYGPEERTGRLVDLDISAFKQLGSTRAGVIYVKVEPI